MISIPISLRIFWQFLRRDYYVQMHHLNTYIINYAILQPITWSILTGYLQANTYFGSANIKQNTILFSGTIIVTLLVVTYKHTIELLFDLETVKFIDYQITIFSPLLVLIERILFTSVLTFLITAPFYPVSKLLLGNYIDTSNTSWPLVMLILYCGSLCCSAYHLMATTLLTSSSSIPTLWKRANAPMIDFGGMWVPWIVIYQFSPTLGYLVYINPIIYISEGLKQAMIGGPEFLSLYLCIPMLLLFTVVFTFFCWFFFKRRTDCL